MALEFTAGTTPSSTENVLKASTRIPGGYTPAPVVNNKVWGLGQAALASGLALGLSVIFSIVMVILHFIFTPNSFQEAITSPDSLMKFAQSLPVTAGSLFFLWLGLFSGPFLAARKVNSTIVKEFGLAFKKKDLLVGVSIAIVATLLEAFLQFILPYFGLNLSEASNTDILSAQKGTLGYVFIGLLAAVGAPFFEELYFRGLLLRAVSKKYTVRIGIIVSSLVFGMLHASSFTVGSLLTFLITASLGVVLALLAVKTNRLGPGIFTHMSFNTIAVLLVFFTAG